MLLFLHIPLTLKNVFYYPYEAEFACKDYFVFAIRTNLHRGQTPRTPRARTNIRLQSSRNKLSHDYMLELFQHAMGGGGLENSK